MLSAAAVLLTAGASVEGSCTLLFILPMEAAMARSLLAFIIMGLITITDVCYFCNPDTLSPLAMPAGMVAPAFVFVVATGSPRPCRSSPAPWREGTRFFSFESLKNGSIALSARALAT